MAEEILREGARRGAGSMDNVQAIAGQARHFLAGFPMDVWVNRHTMIAFTTLMLAAESFGYDTAPMEGFDPAKVKQEFQIPGEAEVVALLALGRMRPPDRVYPGRLPLERIVFSEAYGQPWHSTGA
jgi:nitroreductase